MADNGIGEPIDRKFSLLAISLEHGTTHDRHCAVVFLAKDRAFLATLPTYRAKCEELGVDARQLHGVDLLVERVERYQAANPHLVKVPDIDEGPAGAKIVAPNAERA